MLFSQPELAQFIDQQFESAWQMVRPVPTVNIDFGNGYQVTRTLHGNIATYVCLDDGTVIDVLPGVYEPRAYRTQLENILVAAANVRESSDKAQSIAEYHRLAMTGHALKAPAKRTKLDYSKALVEMKTKQLLTKADAEETESVELPTEEKREWEALVRDTRDNESIRRKQIHQYLADRAGEKPEGLTKWLYREVLHSDLDDPYLGLAQLLRLNQLEP